MTKDTKESLTWIALFLGVIFFHSCNGTEPPPPPTCELQAEDCESGVLDTEACECEPVEPPPPPITACATPLDDRIDEDYIPLERAAHWQRELRIYDQRLVNNGIRNPTFARRECGPDTEASVWPYNGVSADEALVAITQSSKAKNALTGDDGESGFYRRVAEQHPTRREGRSRVYRPCFTESWRLALWLTDGCSDPEGGTLEECESFHPSSSPTGIVSRLDGVKGACQEKLNE